MVKKITLFICCAVFMGVCSIAQSTANYAFETANGLLTGNAGTTQLYGPNVPGTVGTGAQSFSLQDFDFFIMGNRYGFFAVHPSGIIDLNSTTFNSGAPQLFVANQIRLSAFSNNINVTQNSSIGTGPNGRISYRVDGNAPNRILIFFFEGMAIPFTNTGNASRWQVRLHETTGVIEYLYGAMHTSANINNVQIGFGTGINVNEFVSVNSSDNTISTTSITNNNYGTGDLIDFQVPGTRRLYRFTPIQPDAPGGLLVSRIGSSSITVSAQASPTPQAYRYAFYSSSNALGPFTFMGTSNTTNFNFTSLEPNTTYHFLVKAVTEGGISAAGANTTGTTLAPQVINATTSGGNWTDATTWTFGIVPERYDRVTIPATSTVNINGAAACSTLTNLGNILFTSNSGLSVYGNILNQSGATISTQAAGSRGIFLYDGNITNAGTLSFHHASNYFSINIQTDKSFTNTGTITGTDATGTPANTPIIRRFTINTFAAAPVTHTPANLTLNFPLIISENLNLAYGFINSPLTIVLDNTQVAPGTTAGTSVGITHFGGTTTGLTGNLQIGTNATYNLSYTNTYATGVQVTGKEMPEGRVINALNVGNSNGIQLSRDVNVVASTGLGIFLNGHNLTVGTSASQPGSINNQLFGNGNVTRWFGIANVNHTASGTINFAAGTPASFQNRTFSISSSSITHGGTITVRHTDAGGQTAFTQPFFENTTGYVRRSNAGWVVSTGNGLSIGNVQMRLGAEGLFGNEPAPYTTSNMSLADGIAPGTFAEAQNSGAFPFVRRDFASHTELNNTFFIAERDPLLPVKNIVFRAAKLGKNINLIWESTGEETLSHYEIQRSQGNGFVTIGKTKAANALFMQYAFIDSFPPAGRVQYRVAAIDSKDGKAHYSNVVQLLVEYNNTVLQQNYPNPASQNTLIAFTIGQRAKAALRLLSANGQVSKLLEVGNREPGTHHILLNVGDMAPGMYFYQLFVNGIPVPEVKRMVVE